MAGTIDPQALASGNTKRATRLISTAERLAKTMPEPQRAAALTNLEASGATALYGTHDYGAGDKHLFNLLLAHSPQQIQRAAKSSKAFTR